MMPVLALVTMGNLTEGITSSRKGMYAQGGRRTENYDFAVVKLVCIQHRQAYLIPKAVLK